MLLLLTENLELQELLLLLKQLGICRVHRGFVGFLLLVGRDVLVILELLNSRFGFFTLLASALITGLFGLTLLNGNKARRTEQKVSPEIPQSTPLRFGMISQHKSICFVILGDSHHVSTNSVLLLTEMSALWEYQKLRDLWATPQVCDRCGKVGLIWTST